MSQLPVVAAFDFDGTITDRDVLFYFLNEVVGPWQAARNWISLVPDFISYAFGLQSRTQLKEKVFGKFFYGLTEENFKNKGYLFAHNSVKKYIRTKAAHRFQWHQSQGHRCVLVTANIDVVVEPWAQQWGFHDVISVKCAVIDDKMSGKLVGPNCWGPQKVKYLVERIGPRDSYILYAYGNSRGDKELLEIADYAYYRKME